MSGANAVRKPERLRYARSSGNAAFARTSRTAIVTTGGTTNGSPPVTIERGNGTIRGNVVGPDANAARAKTSTRRARMRKQRTTARWARSQACDASTLQRPCFQIPNSHSGERRSKGKRTAGRPRTNRNQRCGRHRRDRARPLVLRSLGRRSRPRRRESRVRGARVRTRTGSRRGVQCGAARCGIRAHLLGGQTSAHRRRRRDDRRDRRVLRLLYPRSVVVAIEPERTNFALLQRNVRGLDVRPFEGPWHRARNVVSQRSRQRTLRIPRGE